MAMDSAAQIELVRSHHEEGTFNLKVWKWFCVPLLDGTIKQQSFAEHKLLEGIYVWINEFR